MRKNKILYTGAVIIAALLISSFSLLNNAPVFNSIPEPAAPGDDFQKEWKAVDSLISLGLPKSALEITEKIYKQALATENHPQYIKSLLYKMRLNADFQEDFLVKIVEELQGEIKKSEPPVKEILYSIQAEIYWRYYQSNRWKFMERSTVSGSPSDDIKTWDLKTIMGRIIQNYQASLEDPKSLKKINLKDYDAILSPGNSKEIRPTLYDFLAHRAVDFFMNDEASLTKPANTFEIDNAEFFSDPKSFSKIDIKSSDSLSLKYYAIRILQDLMDFHLNDKNPDALVDVNLKRLSFVKENAVLPEKDYLYLAALKEYEQTLVSEPVSTLVSYAIAQQLQQTGLQYNPAISDKHRWEIKAAADICHEAIKRFPDSDGAQNCRALLFSIQRKELEITTENVIVPGEAALALVKYKNLENLYLRLAKVDYKKAEQMAKENRNLNELLNKYIGLPVFREWTQALIDEGDFQSHSTEIKIDALPAGYYILLASESAEFNPDSNLIFYEKLWSSNISYISRQNGNSNQQFYMLNRKSGLPLAGVSADLYYQYYDYRRNEYSTEAGGSFTSDENGFFEVPELDKTDRSRNYFLAFNWNNEALITGDRFYRSYYSSQELRKTTRTWFFTDRAIYRPGQTIYFKGIVMDVLGDQKDIKTGYSTTVEFLDANYQKISEVTVTTNDYGSFNATFVAPQGVLNGSMTIRDKSGSQQIRVEEYKRPTFEISFDPIEGAYKINEKVTVKGKAKAYAGNLVSGSQVKYRVIREVRFPWFDLFWRFWPFNNASMEITNGTTSTDDNGAFSIDFTAIPDYSIPEKYKPMFSYTVYADVTDITGETQSAQTIVNVGYEALQVKFDLDEEVDATKLTQIKFWTTNLNDQPVAASGTIKLFALEEPDQLIRERYWAAPDQQVIPEDEFKNSFPYDSYSGNPSMENLKEGKELLNFSFNSEIDSLLPLNEMPALTAGRYQVSAETTDEFGTKVAYSKIFTVYNPGKNKSPVHEFFWFKPLKNRCEPGENASFLIASADEKVRVLYEVTREYKVLKSEWITLNKEQKKIEFPVTEDLRGGFSIRVCFVKNNRSYEDGFRVDVPYTNKELDFEFITFRDKLQPGQKENWQIKIKGKNGDKVAAELLASMYDVSLDAFVAHSWNFDLYNSYSGYSYWAVNQNFLSQGGSLNRPYISEYPKSIYKTYDQLNWFGFDYFGGYYLRGGRADNESQDGVYFMNGVALEKYKNMEESEDGISDFKFHDISANYSDTTGGLQEINVKSSSTQSLEVRRDFRETAFFFPDLKTDEEGNVILSFEMPESLTRWKLMGLAYSKDLKYGQFSKEVITQKDLMVVANAPRFFREGDQMNFTAKLVNLSEDTLAGEVELLFKDPITLKDITSAILKGDTRQSFMVGKDGSKAVSWEIAIPDTYSVVSYEIRAKADDFTDGESKPIPVLTNRMLVTESLPLPVNGNETKKFVFEKLKNSDASGSLKNHKLTLEFSSNPAWYAVQALPYIMEQEQESADHAMNRFYANSIASHLANSNPKIKNVFDAWRNYTPDALLSNLEKNQELKSLILNETPWVMDAKNESEQKQRIALLFDINKMAQEKNSALRKLRQLQSPSGGWPWFKGMRDNRYVSQQVVLGMAHLRQLGVYDIVKDAQNYDMLIRAIRYIDQEMKDDFEQIKKFDEDYKNNDHLNYMIIHYLLARSYFMDEVVISKGQEEAFAYFRDQAIKFWVNHDLYSKGMMAMALYNLGVKSAPSNIIASVKEHALYSEEMGLYFRDNNSGYYWYQAPIETQALLIEAFDKIMNDRKAVEQMKIWLLKQKQTQSWGTSKATASAVYALLLRGSDWLANDKLAEIKIGKQVINPMQRDDTKVEAGTGYFKTAWSGGDIESEMGEVIITNENSTVAWGAVYWQYFEDLDKITPHETPLSLKKQLFVERNTPSGPVIEPFTEGAGLKVGEKIKVRIELRVDRDMEFVHMKDMRASAFEPVNVLSGYRYQDGLGYYESTLDASTNFFFDYLRKGTYVFEYPLVASQKGDFSNGITSIQCMYAPEFASHSEGMRVTVE
ncbi:MAG: hypothetical protein KDC09_11715 [Bacteroidales bacterium]|nr:hypothetical protein [Bacteroidales bacterium]